MLLYWINKLKTLKRQINLFKWATNEFRPYNIIMYSVKNAFILLLAKDYI